MKFFVILIILCLEVYEGESVCDCPCEVSIKLPVTRVGEKLYYVETNTKANWFGAMNFCNLHKMRLVSINNEVENDDLKHHLYSTQLGRNLGMWTSGNDFAVKYNWYWSALGTRVTYFNWAPLEPNLSAGFEHCLEVYTTNNDQLLWNNNGCEQLRYFICEAPAP